MLRQGDSDIRDSRLSTLWCAIFFVVAYVLWLRTFSILRYASGLELLSGVIIVSAVVQAIGFRGDRGRFAMAATACIAGGLFGTTVCPTWERRPHPGHGLVSVQMPTLARNSTVVFLVPTPASYVAAVEPDEVRYVGLNNSLVQLQAKIGLQKLIEDAIGTAPGPIYGIDKTDAFFGQAEPALLRYGLRRTGWCWPIRSNIDNNLRICRLARVNESNGWRDGLEPEGHSGSL